MSAYALRQTRRFARTYKKLHDNVACDVDAAALAVADNPQLGERKKGDLADLFVYKFRSQNQLYLLGLHRRRRHTTDLSGGRRPTREFLSGSQAGLTSIRPRLLPFRTQPPPLPATPAAG